jgi:hypothetical protein
LLAVFITLIIAESHYRNKNVKDTPKGGSVHSER